MSDSKKRYPIVYACDNNFVPLLAASIKSLELNSPGSIKEIYVIDDGIHSRNRVKLEKSFHTDEIVLTFVPVKSVVTKDINIPYFNNAALPVTTFFRLFIETFLPANTEKVLYLDSDMVVLENISRLWETDISGYILAAVQDPGIKTFDCSWGGGVRNYKELGFDGNTKYLNAGLLFINYKEWVNYQVAKKALEAAVKYQKYIVYGDQYCLNVVLGNKWLPLDPLWNHLADSYHPHPFLIHYIGNKPTYTNYSYSDSYKEIFYTYLDQTEWKNFKPVGEITRRIRMIKRFIRKITG